MSPGELLKVFKSQVQFALAFYTLKLPGRVGKQARFFRRIQGSQQDFKGHDPSLFQLFLQVTLFQVASKVTLGKQASSTSRTLSKPLNKLINKYITILPYSATIT